VKSLADLRAEIDDLDGQMALILKRRLAVVDEIGAMKKVSGAPVVDPNREKEILSRVSDIVGERFADDATRLFAALFDISRSRQKGDRPQFANQGRM
jgi:chorismate mutase